MIDMRYKPIFLPQVNVPYDIVIEKLAEENIAYNLVEVDPNVLEPLQGITFNDIVENAVLDDTNPIYIDQDYNILDGHHRFVKALQNNVPLIAVMIKANNKDACRVLNKIQDLYEYEQSHQLEEVEMQNAINYYGDDENQFLVSLGEDNSAIQSEKPSLNPQSIIAFRKEPIKENSVVGNFFTLTPMEGFDKYQIDFENLLDTDVLGISYKDGQQPADILAKIWFPNVNFEEISKLYNMPAINLKNKANAEKAKSFGFDGIKFGDTLIQGLK